MPEHASTPPLNPAAQPSNAALRLRQAMQQLPLLLRILAASIGGYAVAALFSVAVLVFPGEAANKVLWGTLGSFLVWVGVIIWTFSTSTARSALLGLAGVAAILAAMAAWAVWGAQ